MRIFLCFLLLVFSSSLWASDTMNNDFHRLFDALLGQKKLGEFSVNVDDTHVYISAEDQVIEEFKHRLEKALSSQTSFFENLPYRLSTVTSNSDQDICYDDIPEFSITTLEQALELMTRIFGQDALKALQSRLDIVFDKRDGAEYKSGVLYTARFDEDIAVSTHKKIINYLMSYFVELSPERIRKAFNGQAALEKPKAICKAKNIEAVSGMLKKCFGILETNESKRAYIDLGKIYQLIFPPHVKQQNKTVLVLEREHLISHLQQLNGDRILLKIFKKGDQKYAHPMILAEASRAHRPGCHYIVIDHSSSLQNFYNQLSEHILSFTNKLPASNKNSEVRLVFFHHETSPTEIFNICDTVGVKCRIEKSKEEKFGSTRLFFTLAEVFAEINKQKLTERFDVSVTVFTDGKDEIGGSYNDVKNQTSLLEDLSKVFTLGFGNADVDTLTALANSMGGPYIALKSIDDFKLIEDHLDKFKNERELISFAYKLVQDREFKVDLPIGLDASVHPLNIVLPLTDQQVSVHCRGKKIVASIKPENVEEANMTDRIWLLSAEASRIAIDNNAFVGVKLINLKEVLVRLTEISKNELKNNETLLLNTVIERIKLDIKDLENANSTNEAAVANAISNRNGMF